MSEKKKTYKGGPIVTFRVRTRQQKRDLRQKAKAAGMTVTDFIATKVGLPATQKGTTQ